MRSTAVVDVMLKIESTLFGGEGDYFVCWVLVLKGDFRRGGRFGVQGQNGVEGGVVDIGEWGMRGWGKRGWDHGHHSVSVIQKVMTGGLKWAGNSFTQVGTELTKGVPVLARGTYEVDGPGGVGRVLSGEMSW